MAITDPAKKAAYDQAVGFYSSTWAWISQCTAENYRVAYKLDDDKARNIISDCITKWTDASCTEQTVFSCGAFPVGGIRVEFFGDSANTALFGSSSWAGRVIEGCFFNESLVDNKVYENNLKTPVIPLS
jgi:hypothetical protein